MKESVLNAGRKTVIAVVALAFVLMLMTFGAKPAQAETYKLDSDSETLFSLDKCDNHLTRHTTIWYFVDSDGMWVDEDEITLTNVKTSNTKVATVKNMGDSIELNVNCRKTGKATISWNINGVARSRVIYVAYVNPMAKFKYKGTGYLKRFKYTNTVKINKAYTGKRVSVKAKYGWKIVQYTTFKGMYSNATTKKFANGVKSIYVKINTKYPYNGITIIFKNTKNGREQEINFQKAMGNGYSYTG